MSSLWRYRRIRLRTSVAAGNAVLSDGPRLGYWWEVERITVTGKAGQQVYVFVAPESVITANSLDFSYLVDNATFDGFDTGDYDPRVYVPPSETFVVVFLGPSDLGPIDVKATLQVKEYRC